LAENKSLSQDAENAGKLPKITITLPKTEAGMGNIALFYHYKVLLFFMKLPTVGARI